MYLCDSIERSYHGQIDPLCLGNRLSGRGHIKSNATYLGNARKEIPNNCGLLGDGTVHCWGNNVSRQLGVDSVEESSIDPVPVSGGFTFVTIEAGPQHAFGITDGGAAYCWGRNEDGQLGAGFTSALSATPLAVVGDLVFVTITGGWEHTCGLTVDGVVYCWGSNEFGQLGNAAMANSLVPTRVVGQP